MTAATHFGATLRLLRTEAGFGLRELAQRIGVSGAYLSRVENGRDAAPTPDRLIAIADTLGLPPAVLLELARQTGPAVDGYVQRTPEAGALFLEIARRSLAGPQIARIKAFIDTEFPPAHAAARTRRLVDLLPAERIVVGLACSDLDDLVGVAATRLGDDLDARAIADRVLARERDQPTVLGAGFAAPHAAFDDITGETAVLVTLAQPLAIDTPDDRPVRVAVLLISGPDRSERLHTFARVARLASYDMADELASAKTPEHVRAIIERVESLW
jgi:PTS system nitrogen regulatory IIA component